MCPHCQSRKFRKNGYNESGSCRYRCNKCGKSWSDGGKIQGSHPIGDKPLTNAQKSKERRRRRLIDKLID
jgi:transposase-like protein